MLTIAEAVVGSLDAEAHHCYSVGHLPVDGYGLATARVKLQVKGASGINVARTRVEQLDDGITCGCFVGSVLYCGGQLGFVALTQESRHVGAHHQRLLGQYLGHPLVPHHLIVPCHGLSDPGGVEVWCLKFNLYVAIVVAGEHRHPQCSLDVALAQGYLVQVLLVDCDSLLGRFGVSI